LRTKKNVPANRKIGFQTTGSISFDKQLNILNFDKTLNILKNTVLHAPKGPLQWYHYQASLF
jgi:hypothetical protein